MYEQAAVKSAFFKVDDFNRHNLIPGGLSQATKIVAGLQTLVQTNDIALLLDIYITIAVRVLLFDKPNNDISITLGIKYGKKITVGTYDRIIDFCRLVLRNYDYIRALDSQELKAEQAEMKRTFSGRIKDNANKKDDAFIRIDYGKSCENPIYADMIEGSYSYICKIWADERTPLVWKRTGSVTSQRSPDCIDEYALYTPSGTEYGKIYINMYSDITPAYVPVGYYSPELPTLIQTATSNPPDDARPDLNSIIISGELYKDIDFQRLKTSGIEVATFSLHIRAKNDPGRTMTMDVTVWRELAERAKAELKIGDHVIVEGYLTERKWVDRNNNQRVVHEICGNQFYIV